MALHDNDEDPNQQSATRSPILIVLITYLAVCSGCNLSIFLPILMGISLNHFGLALSFILTLTILVVILIKEIGKLSPVARFMDKYSELLMKIIYIGVGIYVFFDSGLIRHLAQWGGLV